MVCCNRKSLVLGSGSEQHPRATSSVRPPVGGCGSAMASLLLPRRRKRRNATGTHTRSRPGATQLPDRGAPGRPTPTSAFLSDELLTRSPQFTVSYSIFQSSSTWDSLRTITSFRDLPISYHQK